MQKNSRRKLKISLNNQEYLVEIHEVSEDILEVEVNGKIHRISVEEVESLGTGEPVEMPLALPATPLPNAAKTASPFQPSLTGTLTTPMPGDIIEIMVKEGDQVEAGQELCVLEAMKMKNILRSPQGGKVSSIEVSVGQSVEYGAVLIRFE
jgi:biotin carboxyl carrier protein